MYVWSWTTYSGQFVAFTGVEKSCIAWRLGGLCLPACRSQMVCSILGTYLYRRMKTPDKGLIPGALCVIHIRVESASAIQRSRLICCYVVILLCSFVSLIRCTYLYLSSVLLRCIRLIERGIQTALLSPNHGQWSSENRKGGDGIAEMTSGQVNEDDSR